jgi:hypothetical protein
MDEAYKIVLTPRLQECADPLFRGILLNHHRTYLPLGIPVEIQSNSEQVIAAADHSFSRYGEPSPLEKPLIIIRICVDPNPVHRGGLPWPSPHYRALHHLFHLSCGGSNFAVADLKSATAVGFVTGEMAQDRDFFCVTFLECLFYLLAVHQRFTPVHCSCVSWKNSAILICGVGGAGKSTLAYACGKARMQIVSDDVVHLAPNDKGSGLVLWGNPWFLRLLPEARALFSELNSIVPKSRNGGEMYLAVDVSKHCEGGTCMSSKPAVLLFLERNPHVSYELSRIPPSAALRRLRQDIVLDTQEVVERHDTLLSQLVQVPAYRMEYSGHPSSVTEMMKALV